MAALTPNINGPCPANLFNVECHQCNGTGVSGIFQCPTCAGVGQIVQQGRHRIFQRYGNIIMCICGVRWYDNDH